MQRASNIMPDLPLNVLDHVISFIVSPQDLLHLALTCRRIASYVVPNHLRQGRILCSPLRSSLWEKLLTQPRTVMKIRSFELIWEGIEPLAPIFPTSEAFQGLLTGQEPQDAFREEVAINSSTPDIIELNLGMMISVVQRMRLLSRFRWQNDIEPPLRLSARLFTSLGRSCPHLKEVTLRSSTSNIRRSVDTAHMFYDLRSTDQLPFTLSKLTRFVWCATDPGQSTTCTILDGLITHCPELSDLSIILPSFTKQQRQKHLISHSVIPVVYLPTFFRKGNWPNLKRLALLGHTLSFHGGAITDTDENEAVVEFWHRHSKLKLLILDPHDTMPSFTVPPEKPSLLQSLFVSYSALESFNLGVGVAQNLVCFQVVGMIYEHGAIASLLVTMSSLRSLTLDHWPEDDLMRLVSAIPRVERLQLRSQFIRWRKNHESHFQKFSPLRRLTHLGGLWKSIPLSARYIPPNRSLRYISVVNVFGDTDETTWLGLQRDKRGNVTGCFCVDQSSIGPLLKSDEDKYFLSHLPEQFRTFM